jgi:hypothetical protein
MIELLIKSPSQDDIVFSDTVNIYYEVKDTDAIFNKVVFEINNQVIEKTERTGLFSLTLPKNNYTLVGYIKNKFNKEIPNTKKTIVFETKPVTLELKNKLSTIVESTIPDFLEQDYVVFVEFVKEYYKWLESTKNLNYIPHNLENYFDIDSIPPEFLDTYFETYLSSLPKEFAIDIETGNKLEVSAVIKRVRDFYAKKGTEDSFRFLFRLMFDTEITLNYPREKIFKLSAAEWFTPIFVRAKNLNEVQATSIIGKEIYFLNTNNEKTFSAIVVDAFFGNKKDKNITTLYLEDVQGSFSGSSLFYKTKTLGVTEEIEIKLYPMIVSTNFVDCPKNIRTPNSFGNNKKYDFKIGERLVLEPLTDQNVICLSTCQSELQQDLTITGESLNSILNEWNLNWSSTDYDEGIDLNNNNVINNTDLSFVLNNTGPCKKCIVHTFSNQNIVKPSGFGFYAVVEKTNEKGEITKIRIIDPGVNYNTNNIRAYSSKVVGPDSKKSYDCRIRYNIGYLFIGDGYYRSRKSVLGNFSVLQDNYYYQENSYEIGASVTPYRYSDILKRNVHPAGYQAFYRYDILDLLLEPPEIRPQIDFGVVGYDTSTSTVLVLPLQSILSNRNAPISTVQLQDNIINNTPISTESEYNFYNDSDDFPGPVESYFPEVEINTNEATDTTTD